MNQGINYTRLAVNIGGLVAVFFLGRFIFKKVVYRHRIKHGSLKSGNIPLDKLNTNIYR